MKKVLSVVLCLGLFLGMTGCGSSNSDKPKEDKKEEKKQEENIKKEKSLSFESFEKALKDNGFEITDTITMAADLIGGIEGVKFETSEGNVEIYKFDKNSDAYKKVVNEGKVTLEGFGDFSATCKNEYVVLDPSDKVISILNNF